MKPTRVVHPSKKHDIDIGYAGPGRDGYFAPRLKLRPGEDLSTFIAVYREEFRERLRTEAGFKERVLALEGKRLACPGAPGRCYGGVIAKYLNGLSKPKERRKAARRVADPWIVHRRKVKAQRRRKKFWREWYAKHGTDPDAGERVKRGMRMRHLVRHVPWHWRGVMHPIIPYAYACGVRKEETGKGGTVSTTVLGLVTCPKCREFAWEQRRMEREAKEAAGGQAPGVP